MIIYLGGNILKKKSDKFKYETRLNHIIFSFEYLNIRKGFSETRERFLTKIKEKKK